MKPNAVMMQGRVLRVGRDNLLLRDCETRQEVQVNTPMARRFRRGDRLIVLYSGAMTMSIPPQISAIEIRRSLCCR